MKLVIGKKEYEVKPLSIVNYEYFLDNKDVDDLELIQRFTECPLEELKKVEITKLKFISKMLTGELGGVSKTEPLHLTTNFNGKNYGLIKPSELTYEEWVNLEVFMSETPLNLPLLATHFYKPLKSDKVGEERELIDYDLSECNSRVEEFKDFPIKVLLSGFFFIGTFAEILTESFHASTITKMKNKKKQLKMKTNQQTKK